MIYLFGPWTQKNTAEASWFDDNFAYRQISTVTNNGSAQTNYQVQLQLDSKTLQDAGKMQTDCDDIRVTDVNGNLLQIWTEYCSTTTSVNSLIWATIPSIPASSTTNVYIYYGNPSASSGSFYTSQPSGINVGTGIDGAITISSDTNINTADSISGRACSDTTGGDAVIYTVTANTPSAQNSITLSSTPNGASTCISVGDEIIIVNLQGTTSDNSNVGKFETARITAIASATLTLNHNLTNSYDGTTQKIVVQRVPNYTSVTISTSGTDFTASTWDGTTNFYGGIMMFRANGTVSVASGTTINANSAGFAGGLGGAAGSNGGANAESYDGKGSANVGEGGDGAAAGTSGGGDGGENNGTAPIGAVRGGGGGGGSASTGADGNEGGGGGAGGGYGFGGGGGGGAGDSNGSGGNGGTAASGSANGGGGGGGCAQASAGAGGAGGNAGSAGTASTCTTGSGDGGAVGSGTTGAGGGGGADSQGQAGGGGGGGGGSYGAAALTTLYLGSGGGGGGGTIDGAASDKAGTDGTAGGGIVYIGATTLSNSGTIQANGGNAASSANNGGDGGAGSGGAIFITASTATIGTTGATATGGTRNTGCTRRGCGGAAGDGRIRAEYSTSTGTGNPTLSTSTLPVAGATATEEKSPVATLYWKFDDGTGTNANDSSQNNLDGTLNNTPTWQTEDQCISGKCLYFNGTTNMNVSKSDDGKLDFIASDSFTIGAWVKRNGASSANNFIITKAQSGYTGYKLYQDPSGDYCFDVSDGTNTDSACTSAVEFDDDSWHLVQGVKIGTTSVTLFVDGKQRAQDSSIAATGTLANTGTFYTGVDLDGISNEWLGFIDEVKVYNFARSASQIQADYNARSNPEGSSQFFGSSFGNSPNALSNGLVGYWKLEEAATPAVDSSGNGYSGTWAGNTAQANGRFGYGATFDGTGDYIDTGSRAGPTGGFSVSLWFKPGSVAITQIMASQYNGTNAYFQLFAANTTVTFRIQQSIDTVFIGRSATGVLDNGTWQLYTATWDGSTSSSGIKIYKNGAQVDDANSQAGSFSAPNSNSIAFQIGAQSSGSNSTNGVLDDVRVYNRALSNNEVSQLYNFAPAPVGYWRFDEKTGTAASDSSGNGNEATLTNTPTWINGKFGGAINFAGSDQQVTRADDADFDFADDADMTYEAWIKHNTASAQEIILSKYNEAGYKLIMESDGDLTCALDYDSTWTPTDSATSTAATYDDNNWHHIACVKNGASSLSLYIDGILITTDSSLTATNTLTNSDPLYIGIDADGTSNDFIGQIDEPKIYNYARTTQQIIQDMNAGHPAPGSPVGSSVAYWKFDEGYLTTANDSSINANNLTLSSASWTNTGKFNKAWNGTGALWLSRADDADFDFAAAEDFSISLWFKSDSTTNPASGSDEYFVTKGTITNTGTVGYAIYVDNNGKINFGIRSTSGVWGASSPGTPSPEDTATSTSDLYDNIWHHIVATKTGTSRIDLYVDGKLDASDTSLAASATLANSITSYIGDDDGDSANSLNGDLDDVKIYRSALTADQVKVDYNRGSSQILGALSDNSTAGQSQAAAQEYCIPGDSTSCTGPIGEWKFDERTGTSAYDTSTNGSTGTLNGNAAYETGKLGSAITLDGTSDYVSMGDVATLDMADADAFTISYWVYRTSMPQDSAIVAKKVDNIASNIGYHIEQFTPGNGGDTCLYVSDATDQWEVCATADTTLNTWQHYAFVFDNSTSAGSTVYKNGVNVEASELGTIGNVGDTTNTLGFCIGTNAAASGTCATNKEFAGKIDNVRVFRRALTQAQVVYDYNRGKPIGYWKMDECQGTTINDSSGNSYTGTLTIGATGGNTSVGTCTTPTDGTGAWYDGLTGKRNYSIQFDGTDDYFQVSDTANLRFDAATEDFSLFAWVKRATTGTEYIISKEDADNDGWRIMFNSSNQVLCSEDATDVTSSTAISDTNWHLVGCTIDRDGNGQTYIDGKADGSAVSMGSDAMATTSAIRIATRSYTSTSYLNGQIDDARIYNYPLTATQVKTLYSDGAIRFGPVTGAP